MLNRIPKSCWIARSFGSDAKEARRQLPIWKHSSNRGVDTTVHLYHTKTRGWAIVMCGSDYTQRKKGRR